MSRGRRILRAGGIFACSVFALLLWSKLKLVSGIPRTAYATPEQTPEPAQAGGDPATPAGTHSKAAPRDLRHADAAADEPTRP